MDRVEVVEAIIVLLSLLFIVMLFLVLLAILFEVLTKCLEDVSRCCFIPRLPLPS